MDSVHLGFIEISPGVGDELTESGYGESGYGGSVDYRPWLGPPNNVLGTAVAMNVVLTRTEEAAIALSQMIAYPTGLDIELVGRSRTDSLDMIEALSGSPRAPRLPGLVHFGVKYPDGRGAVYDPWNEPGPSGEPEPPVLQQQRGGGSNRAWEQSYWLWPLPDTETLLFFVEWPKANIPVTGHTIQTSSLLEAANRAVELWPL
jgi:hypothetical protein